MSIITDVIEAVKWNAPGNVYEDAHSSGQFDTAVQIACDAVLAEYRKRLVAEPPLIMEVEILAVLNQANLKQVITKLPPTTPAGKYWLIPVEEKDDE